MFFEGEFMNALNTSDLEIAAATARSCREVQREWCERSFRERLVCVRSFRRLLVSEGDALCKAARTDLDKGVEEVLGGEVLPLADACKFLESHAANLLQPRRVGFWSRPLWLLRQRDTIFRRPRGVIGIIGTWNYPLLLNGVQIMQAVVAGNGVVLKPSEVAPASAQALFSLLGRAGFPPGLIQMLPATREGGPALIEAEIDHLVFTGSASVGRQVATRLGQRLISSTLELSGCDPMFILPDADIDLAATAAWFGATVNCGQTCIATRRAFIHRSIYDEVASKLEPWAAGALPVPLALPGQARQADRLVTDALSKGGRLLGGLAGDPSSGAKFRPAVIADATVDMDVCREASFAPLLALLPYDELDEAVRIDALCPYGLGASVFTRQPREAEELASRLRIGMVTINDVVVPTTHAATPFGGVRQSGWGVTQGAEGLLEMTVPQLVSIRRGSDRPHFEMLKKGTGSQEGLVRGLLRFCHGWGLRERWRGLRQLLRALRNKS
jgi:acyl-CoA reductase-like NAD-dependent aldehyde dehydrogenase